MGVIDTFDDNNKIRSSINSTIKRITIIDQLVIRQCVICGGLEMAVLTRVMSAQGDGRWRAGGLCGCGSIHHDLVIRGGDGFIIWRAHDRPTRNTKNRSADEF